MKPLVSRTLQQLGLTNLLWNRVEMLWYLYFTTLMPAAPRSHVDAIYRSHDTGNKKRMLIASIAGQVHPPGSSEHDAFRVAMAHTNDAASTRNALIHADFHLATEGGATNLRISRGGDHSKPNRLAFTDLEAALATFAVQLRELVQEVEQLLPDPPAAPPGVPAVLRTTDWVRHLDELLSLERTEGDFRTE